MSHAHIMETLGLTKWGSRKLQASSEETLILRNWGIQSIPAFVGAIGGQTGESNSPEAWKPPPPNIFKLNFDGQSKGNPGPASFGGAIRNSEGRMVGMCWGYIHENTNNEVELKWLLASMDVIVTYGWFPIILEGDSQLILEMTTKLLHGKPVNMVANN